MDKWFMLFLIALCAALFAPLIMKEHGDSQCRIAALNANVPAEKIATACGLNK